MFLKNRVTCLLVLLTLLFFADAASAQSELAPWGNITGIRRHGQLFEFETSLKVVSIDGLHTSATAKEKQRPGYTRDGKEQVVNTNIDSLYFKETVRDRWDGKISITIKLNCRADTVVKGVYFCITLPGKDYADGKLRLIKAYADSLGANTPAMLNAQGLDLVTNYRKLTIKFDAAMPVVIKKDLLQNNVVLYMPLVQGALHKGDSLQRSFTIKASGDIDRSPAYIAVDTTKQGNPFVGFGGNFRLQNAKNDPQVIDYCLNNLRVAWGRVEMPWRFWQPKEDVNPADSVRPPVIKAMEMAQRLNKMNIPVILTAWAPPAWAIVGKPNFKPVKGVWGNPLDSSKMPEIYKSITDYILYLKANYGVEVKLFSFNESDLGINIRVSSQQHDELIKGLGAYFAAHGLQTKMLLGDNSDATTYKFIYPALNDTAAQPYIGAISFHSWRGCTDAILQKWVAAAKQANLPLIVGEGSIDAQASGYPQVFQEPTYALQEINLYTRLLNICQPLSILQWQLTSDYSPLIGGGIFGNNEPLHPGQRFYNLKQLASTQAHLFALPVTCTQPEISCAALGDHTKGIYTLHLVNNGPSRDVTITGLPAGIKIRHLYITNQKAYMEEKHAKTEDGKIAFKMQATSYYTLVGDEH